MIEEILERKLFYNGYIITMNEYQPNVEAIGIQNEKIFSVGKLEEVKEDLGKIYGSIDLKGNTLLPGFIDCHMHPLAFMFLQLNLDLSNVKSLQELRIVLRNHAKEKPKGELIFGLNLREEEFDVPILPDRWDLDDASLNHPVFIIRYDGHIGIMNTRALELVGFQSRMQNPVGGEIRKNKKGELTGIVSENALYIARSKISKFLNSNYGVMQDVASRASEMFAMKGITSLHGIIQSTRIPIYKSIQDKILQNWYAFISTDKPKNLKRLKKLPLDGGKEDSKFKVGTLKLFLDGTFGAKTACMWEPFSDAPDSCGYCIVDEEEIYDKMKVAHNNGFQIAIHVIGDKGNRICMDLYKKLLREFPRENHRHRIEHASMLTKDVIKDMKDYGIIASCQPQFINSEYTWLEKRIGLDRCKYTYPYRSLTDSGVILASGSDCPVEDPDVILGLHALVTRNNLIPEECISMFEALKSYTINGAYAAFEEKVKGSIEVGKLADFVILDKNPLEIEKDKIKEIQVLETIIRGKTVYKKRK
ncbi:hypothetical protein LCGC14_0517880 [marine sediment metagenome]|uniref:Amidohydrolase 3 domain-containing protein n=1 Tax=marine sediment metagenome TaxID=412755 RepID=A0A0F9UKY7_9ZZZZ